MEKPKHGILIKNNNEWFFRAGTKATNPLLYLVSFKTNIINLIQSHQLYPGNPNYAKVIQSKNNLNLGNAVAKHVSAIEHTNNDVPTLLQHRK